MHAVAVEADIDTHPQLSGTVCQLLLLVKQAQKQPCP